jgi:ABC-2 type transport system ATP-binding protein
MITAVEAKNLTKLFGTTKALDGLSFTVKEAEIYGLIGSNGAGKTTTLGIISTLIIPTSGTAHVFDHNVVKEVTQARAVCNRKNPNHEAKA